MLMKKTILTIAVGVALSLSGFAQVQRTILYEEFSGENCAPCASTNASLMPFIHRAAWYPSKILLVKYQVAIPSAPGPGSLYQNDPTDGPARQTYYVPTVTSQSAPYARFDGIELPEPPSQGTGSNGHAYWLEDSVDYPNIINDSAIVNSPFALTVNHIFSTTYDSVTVTAVITSAQNYTASTSGALVLQLAMEEAYIHFAIAPGTNGETDFYNVVRTMLPSNTGTVLNNTWASAATQTVTLKAAIPSYIHDKNQLCFVAFVQDNGPKRVHQAAFSMPKSVSLDASTTATSNAAVLCGTSIPVTATVTNTGATTMTSCNINYKLDAGTVTTYSWTGSLVQGATTTYSFTIAGATSGTHTISVYTSLPNGGTDQNPANDKQTSIIVIEGTPSGTPVVQGFTVTTFPPANWVINDPQSGANTWHKTTAAGNAPTPSESALYPFYNNSATGAKGSFFMPIENLSAMAAPQLKFDYAYDYYDTLGSTGYDSVAVMASIDCGNTWTTLWQQGGTGLSTATTPGNSNANGFLPTASEWKTQTISLSAYSTATSFLAKFVTTDEYGNNFYLDNVNISAATGIKENHGNISAVNVYPNPTSNQFSIDVNMASSEKTTVTVYNMIGQPIFAKTFDFDAGQNIQNVPVDQLSSGVYTVLVSSSTGIYQTKINVIK